LIVRLSNPFFKGLGWLGGTFAAGALGAAVFNWSAGTPAGAARIFADTLILLAYVLLHLCILELTENKLAFPKFGAWLLAAQAGAYVVFLSIHHARQFSVVTLGLLVAAQALQTALHLTKTTGDGMRAPVWFSISLLVMFAGFNLFRSIAVLILGTPENPLTPNPFEVASAVVYLGTGLGIGFGVFWMTSAEIRLKLEKLASIDPLTGLCNRRSFLSWCERELLASTRTREPFSLILIDVDDFKRVNDNYGHDFGDSVLCAVVGKLRNGVRNIDVLGRWGGEEFVALLPGADASAALLVAQRLLYSVESLSLVLPPTKSTDAATTLSVTISLGVSTYSSPDDRLDALFRRCDLALYQAKSEGRNRIIQTISDTFRIESAIGVN